MYNQIFGQSDLIDNNNPLEYRIVCNPNGCSVKIENQSPYALDIYNGTDHIDRIHPYSYATLQNIEYTVKVNRDIVTENKQPFNFVAVKNVVGSTAQTEGSMFNGTANVAGNMYVEGGNIDAYVQGNVEVTGGQVEISGPVQAEITSGTINANIENAKIDTELINTSLATNRLTLLFDEEKIFNTPLEMMQYVFRVRFQMGLYSRFTFQLTSYYEDYDENNVLQKYRLYSALRFHKSKDRMFFLDSVNSLTDTTQLIMHTKKENREFLDEGYTHVGLPGAEVGLDREHFDIELTEYRMTQDITLTEAIPVNSILTNVIYHVNPVPTEPGKFAGNLPQSFVKGCVHLKIYGYLTDESAGVTKVEITNENFKGKMRGVDYSNGNLNNITMQGTYSGYGLTNTPSGASGFCTHINYRGENGSAYALQYFTNITADTPVYVRKKVNGTWSSWTAIAGGGDTVSQYGSATITVPSAGGTATTRVTFPKPFTSIPAISTNVATTNPDSAKASARNITATYFDLTLYKTDTYATPVTWMAIGK